jgi:Ca2+-binding EF-hand superfamily protein
MQRATDHFAYFDKDRNGTISRAEFSELYKNLKSNG